MNQSNIIENKAFSPRLCVAEAPVMKNAPVVHSGWENVTPQDVLKRAGKTFAFANRFFPQSVREDVARLYAFCRIADDLADNEASPVDDRRRALDKLERSLFDSYTTGDPGPSEVAQLFHRHSVPLVLAHELLLGVRSDLEEQHFETFEDLRTYCFRVASTVGLMLCHIWGVRADDALIKAEALGVAMQLTNISRDIGEDRQRGRFYLPLEWLDEAGTNPANLNVENLRPLLEKTMRTADENYAMGLAGVTDLPQFARFPVQLAAYLYRDIHTQIRANDYDVINRRASTSFGRKLWIAARVAIGAPPAIAATPRETLRDA